MGKSLKYMSENGKCICGSVNLMKPFDLHRMRPYGLIQCIYVNSFSGVNFDKGIGEQWKFQENIKRTFGGLSNGDWYIWGFNSHVGN